MVAKVPPKRGSALFISKEELKGKLIGGIGAENGELWGGMLLLGTTGNKGWETGMGGVVAGIPGGVIGNVGWSPGGAADGIGGRILCTGNKGCWGNPGCPGSGTETVGCWGYHGWGRGGICQAPRGPGILVL